MQSPFFDIFTRYARYARIMDLDPPETLTFEEFYKFCLDMKFFNEMQELGYITYSQDNQDNQATKPFQSSEINGKRHLVLALSSFLSSIYSKETAKIKTPHEHGGYFISTFTRLDASTVQCLTDGGKIIKFYFDNTKPCNF
jgi:hypothetical protein